MWDAFFDLLWDAGLIADGWLTKREPRMPLRLYNTLSGELEEFKPVGKVVKMYNCGPTPYDEQHIGNLFGQVMFNVLRRSLEVWGYPVKQVTNITDFGHLSSDADSGDDKMTLGLRREGLSFSLENMRTLAKKYTDIFVADLEQLGIDTHKILFPRASDHIPRMIAIIQTLEQKSYAYTTSDGVYFNTAKFDGYGRLGGINFGSPEAVARVAINTEKKNPHDFALWKFNKTLGWESPWGKGFPGWHIECTAMVFTLLGRQIDIHTGGIEHVPIHHNNEIAQAEAASGKQYVRYWLHNAHITIEGKKISKSLGNTVYLHNIVDRGFNPRALRYWFLTGHYRTPMNFTWDALEGANTALARMTRFYLELPNGGSPHEDFITAFYKTIAEDLDTPKALARVWDFIRTEGPYQSVSLADKKATLACVDDILGLGLAEARPSAKLSVIEQSDLPLEIQKLVSEREAARAAKDFTKADELRTRIEAHGFELKDTPEGPEISKK